MDFIRSRNGIERLRKKATDRGFIEDDCCIFTIFDTSYNALDYYMLLDSFYNIKISRMLDVPLWTCGWLTYFVYYNFKILWYVDVQCVSK
jgi:hypothetical protein